MSRVVLVMVTGIGFSNPVVVEFLSEFQVAPDSLERIELNTNVPIYQSLDGWQVVTSAGTALVDSGFFLEDTFSFVVLDRTNVTGPFGLDDGGGSIVLVNELGFTADELTYPGNAGPNTDEAWTPPTGMSCCREDWWYWVGPTETQNCADWYLDVTPTFGQRNDDGGTRISGSIRGPGNVSLADARVRISSELGYEETRSQSFFAGVFELYPGLGTFQVTAHKDGYLPGAWPDSITVEPGDSVSGIDIELEPLGVEEEPGPLVTWLPGRLVFTSPYPVQAEVGLFEPDGRRLWRSSLDIGERTEVELPGLRTGVEFCRILYDGRVVRRKLAIP